MTNSLDDSKSLNISKSYSKIVRKVKKMIETVKMSSKGQIVIPQNIRDEIQAQEGTLFAVIRNKNAVILKKIETPSKEELLKSLGKIADEGRKRLESKGIRESDMPKIVEQRRARKD